jgi:aspartate aminotransferase
MSIQLSHRARAIKPSPTLTVSAIANKMKAQGIDVINFGVGEPDFNTPEPIKEAAKKAIDNNFTRYTDSSGIKELREAIATKLKRDNNLDCNPRDILVSPGAKASIINVLMAVCDPRDEVIVPAPYWVSYTSQIEMVDAFPIIVPTNMSNNFQLRGKQLEDAILSLSNPKALIINSPNNPTGAVYGIKTLERIAEICLKHKILIISDEIYEKLIYDGKKHISIASISEEVRENTVVINGLSKAYAMTGWRLGYAAGPTNIIRCASEIQSHTTSCVNSMTQKAAVTALNECEDSVIAMCTEFEKRRNFIIEELLKIPNVRCNVPQGAFYAMPNVSYYLLNNKKNIFNSIQLCEYLLENFHIALVPGLAFGAPHLIRFSYALSMENIKNGVSRFAEGLKSIL